MSLKRFKESQNTRIRVVETKDDRFQRLMGEVSEKQFNLSLDLRNFYFKR